jgi:HK97 family phage portal protein
VKSLLRELSARTPVPYVASRASAAGLFGNQRGGGQTAQLEAMGSLGTLFSIVNRVSTAQAQVEWKLYRKRTDGRTILGPTSDTRVEVHRHQALNVWNKPNPFMTQAEFIEALTQHIELTGEGWFVANSNDILNFPTEIWIPRPDRMSIIPSKEDFISGYVYNGPDGEKIPLDTDQVVMVRVPNPMDPYRGMGAVQTILTDAYSIEASTEWSAKFFANSAEPGGIIEIPDGYTDEQFTQFKERWSETHRGVNNAHRVGLLENGAKWVSNTYSMRDLQFAELADVKRAVIREAFGISKTMLGLTEDVNRATAEAAEFVFGKWVLVPRLDRIRDALNNDFLPMFGPAGEGVEFDYVSPVPEDLDREAAERTSKVAAAVALVNAGWDAAEVLDSMGLPEMTFTKKVAPIEPITQGTDPTSDPSTDPETEES